MQTLASESCKKSCNAFSNLENGWLTTELRNSYNSKVMQYSTSAQTRGEVNRAPTSSPFRRISINSASYRPGAKKEVTVVPGKFARVKRFAFSFSLSGKWFLSMSKSVEASSKKKDKGRARTNAHLSHANAL